MQAGGGRWHWPPGSGVLCRGGSGASGRSCCQGERGQGQSRVWAVGTFIHEATYLLSKWTWSVYHMPDTGPVPACGQDRMDNVPAVMEPFNVTKGPLEKVTGGVVIPQSATSCQLLC